MTILIIAFQTSKTTAEAPKPPYREESPGMLVEEKKEPPTYESEEAIKQLIRETFPEESDRALRVARCESGIAQFHDNGEPVQGPTQDFGLFQIHMPSHRDRLDQLGLDVKYSIEDNIAYARLLYDSQGWQPWSASEHCWGR